MKTLSSIHAIRKEQQGNPLPRGLWPTIRQDSVGRDDGPCRLHGRVQHNANPLLLKGIGSTFFFFEQPLLSLVHPPEDQTSVDLCSRESNVQQRCGHFEGNLPAIPETSKQPHRHHSLTCGASCGGNAGEKKDVSEKSVTCRKDAIEDDGNVWEEFGYYIESACDEILIFEFLTCRGSRKCLTYPTPCTK